MPRGCRKVSGLGAPAGPALLEARLLVAEERRTEEVECYEEVYSSSELSSSVMESVIASE
jgi:hypothetical protein